MDKKRFNKLILSHCLITGPDLSNSVFDSISVIGGFEKHFNFSKIENCDFIESTFEDCDFRCAKFNSCSFRNVSFNNCILNFTEFFNCSFEKVRFYQCELKETDFSKNDLSDTLFKYNKYDKVNFQQANLQKSELEDISTISFWENEFSGAILPPYYGSREFEISHELGGFIAYTCRYIIDSDHLKTQEWKVGNVIEETVNFHPFSNCGIKIKAALTPFDFRLSDEVWKGLLKFEDSIGTIPYGKFDFKCSKLLLLEQLTKEP